jgi:hypothetical protein
VGQRRIQPIFGDNQASASWCRGAAGAKVDEPSRPLVPCYTALALASQL